jgi:hypothetical protein
VWVNLCAGNSTSGVSFYSLILVLRVPVAGAAVGLLCSQKGVLHFCYTFSLSFLAFAALALHLTTSAIILCTRRGVCCSVLLQLQLLSFTVQISSLLDCFFAFIFSTFCRQQPPTMPPASTTSRANEKERLHKKFSAAATALADLYRESSNAYEAGYRDAILFVQRYLKMSSPASPEATTELCTSVNTAQMMRFLNDTVAARRERVAVVRGVRAMRRRQRGVTDAADEPSRFVDGQVSASDGETIDAGEAEQEGEEVEEKEEEEAGLTLQPSPALNSGALHTVRAATPVSRESADSTLNQEMEFITHLEAPLQPLRQRRRTDRTHNTDARRLHSPRPHSHVTPPQPMRRGT